MSHVTCMQGNWFDSWLLGVRSQIANLTPDVSFGHNLCFRCPNESCKPILDIYVSIFFQWYRKFFNPMGFDPLKLPSEDLGVHWDSNSQYGSSFGSVRVHSLTFFCTPRSIRCDSRASLLACNLISPCLVKIVVWNTNPKWRWYWTLGKTKFKEVWWYFS
jgi:hypothetical protein